MVVGGKGSKRGGGGGKSKRGGLTDRRNVQEESGMWDRQRDLPESSDSYPEDHVAKQEAKSEQQQTPLIETHNPNRIQQKSMKLSSLGTDTATSTSLRGSDEDDDAGLNGSTGLSRRDREELEKERKKQAFWKAQSEGTTDQARADLARLAIIRKQREEAARKKQEELAAKNQVTGAKKDSLNAGKALMTKTLGKK